MDTIAAISTAQAVSAIGILRISGDTALSAADAVFRPADGRPLSAHPHRTMVYGALLDRFGQPIDHILAVTFAAGSSYTGEDSAEFHCHGSPVVLSEGLQALFAAGARQALGGEFTKRAFLSGNLDLTQAEAVIDLIESETADAARNAVGQLSGSLRRRIDAIYDSLLDITSRFYAVVDYPDEDIEDLGREDIRRTLTEAEQTLAALLASFGRGQVLKTGIPTAIVGRPNVGKSSLLNALVGYDRAIVTDIAGTTRDTVEEKAVVGGVLLRLIDTAGIHPTDDAVEQLGVERSRKAVEDAQLVIAVLDGVEGPTEADEEIIALASRAPRWILAESKSDLLPQGFARVMKFPKDMRQPDSYLTFSSVAPDGLRLLEDAVAEIYPAGDTPVGQILTNARQAEAVGRALDAVRGAKAALELGLTPDAILTDGELALSALGELTGKTAREDMVNRIFERFCVGK